MAVSQPLSISYLKQCLLEHIFIIYHNIIFLDAKLKLKITEFSG